MNVEAFHCGKNVQLLKNIDGKKRMFEINRPKCELNKQKNNDSQRILKIGNKNYNYQSNKVKHRNKKREKKNGRMPFKGKLN